MENLKEQLERLAEDKISIIKEINDLLNNESLKKYFELCKQKRELESRQVELYRKMKIEEYSSCNHIWINTLHDYDRSEGRSYNYYGCIKCGLDQKVFHLIDIYGNIDELTFDQQIMYNFLKGYIYRGGIYTKVSCNLDLAKAIYAKIKEVHPDIDDETARKYFEIALSNIRNNKVSEERKANRARRLMLNPKFNKWRGYDVQI